jgi:iron complex outermembrane receptor protein
VRVQAGKPKADTSRVNAFGGGSWKDTPASVNVLERDYLDRRQVRSLSELASNDASLGDAYAPVGYYQNIAIRGFALDAATGYRFNGLSIAGEQRLALENVQSVEILKGEAGLAAGVMAPGGSSTTSASARPKCAPPRSAPIRKARATSPSMSATGSPRVSACA